MHVVILTTIWFIWKVRNDLVFNLTVTSPGKVVAEIKSNFFPLAKKQRKRIVFGLGKMVFIPFLGSISERVGRGIG